MRILHVDPERAWGGGEVQVLGLLDRQARGGHAVRLAADPAGRLAREAIQRGIPVAALRVRNHADLRAGWRLRRLVGDADVVHFHTARAHALAPALIGTGARRVVTRRMDYVPRGGPYVRLLYGPLVDAVIAISQGVRDALIAGGVSPARIHVVPSGVDLERLRAAADAREVERRALGVGAGDLVVLGLGSLERRKGFDLLVAALARGDRAGLRLVLAGEGAEAERLERQAARLRVPLMRVGFRDDVAPLLAAADVLAAPSRAEGLGIAVLEAMAAGRAVVATAVGGLREVVRPDETGLVVPPDDVEALAAALERLRSDGGLRARLGAAAEADVRARYSLDTMAAGTLACYGEAP